MIIQNQIECLNCGDTIYSASVHDFKWCSCKSVAVDGGRDYLKRIGEASRYIEKSIIMDDKLAEKCQTAIREALDSGRNELGVLCAVLRTIGPGISPIIEEDSNG